MSEHGFGDGGIARNVMELEASIIRDAHMKEQGVKDIIHRGQEMAYQQWEPYSV